MRSAIFCIVGTALLSASFGIASAGTVGFVDSPATNSSDWASSLAASGGAVATGVNFDTHPAGSLDPGFHQSTFGVTLTSPDAVFIASGGSSSGDLTGPLSSGEGSHDGSPKLWFPGHAGVTRTLTIDFDAPVLGVGLFLIDLWNPDGTGTLASIEVFDGAGATGNSLGSYSAPGFNFQLNHQTFLGVVSSEENIRSARFTSIPAPIGDSVAVDDIRFARLVPVPPAAWLGLLCLGTLAAVRMRRRRAD